MERENGAVREIDRLAGFARMSQVNIAARVLEFIVRLGCAVTIQVTRQIIPKAAIYEYSPAHLNKPIAF